MGEVWSKTWDLTGGGGGGGRVLAVVCLVARGLRTPLEVVDAPPVCAADSFEASGEHAKGAAALTCAQPLPRVRDRAACPPKRRLSIRRQSFSKPPRRWDSKCWGLGVPR